MPAKEIGVSANDIGVPAKEIGVPAKEIGVPAKERGAPATLSGVLLAMDLGTPPAPAAASSRSASMMSCFSVA